MSKEEALKILNFTNVENINTLSKEQITSRADKYIEMNNPAKGGSFYIQNKVLYAKETLLAYYNMNNNKPITKKEYKH
jgi:import inner membrane translocase subunit TIM16